MVRISYKKIESKQASSLSKLILIVNLTRGLSFSALNKHESDKLVHFQSLSHVAKKKEKKKMGNENPPVQPL